MSNFPPNSPDVPEALATQYTEVGEWARHYSNVRMTVAPGLAALSLAILQFGIGKSGMAGYVPMTCSLLIWLAAIVILVTFTYATNRTREHWVEIQFRLFPQATPDWSNVFLMEKWRPGPAQRPWSAYMDTPAIIGLLLTLAYVTFWILWALEIVS